MSRVGSIELYEDYYIVRTSFGKKEHKRKYNTIKEFAFQPESAISWRVQQTLYIYFSPPIKSLIFNIEIVSFSSVITLKQIREVYRFLRSKDVHLQALRREFQRILDNIEDE